MVGLARTSSPLAGHWYDLGIVTIDSSDNASSLTLTCEGGSGPVCLVGYSDHYYYDAAGELTEKIDRNGRATTFDYDGIGRETAENWFATSNTSGSPTETLSYTYNAAGLLESASDYNAAASSTASNAYTYDAAGRVLSETQQIPGLTPTVVLSSEYTAGNRTQLAAVLTTAGTPTHTNYEFVNAYQYEFDQGTNIFSRMSRVSQSGVSGTNTSTVTYDAVAAKSAAFEYNRAGEFTAVSRYADATAMTLVAHADYEYDRQRNLTSLIYSKTGSALPYYSWTFDPLGNMETATNNTDGTVDYTSDSTGQLLTATGGPPNESYTYDANGNRTNTGYSTGPNNQLLSDGTFNYTYDAEGNRTSRTRISSDLADDHTTEYVWDNRNRLTSVTFKDNNEDVTKTVTYTYDANNRWLGETIAVPGESLQQTRYVYDGTQIIAQFDKTGSGDLAASDLSHRYLWGPAVDQILADEQVTSLETSGNVLYTLTDHQNTVRDLATYDSENDITTIANHRVFSAYGALQSQTNAAVDCLFGYTGRPLSVLSVNATTGGEDGVQNNGGRWYDAIVGRWLSEDPIGYTGGINLYEYVGDDPLTRTDPQGLMGPFGIGGTNGGPPPQFTPLTPPRKPESLCDNISKSCPKCCKQACLDLLKKLQDAAANVPAPSGRDKCQKWEDAFEQYLGKHPLGLGNNPCVKSSGLTVFKWFTPWSGHAAYKVTLCNGKAWYVDFGSTSIGGSGSAGGVGVDVPWWMWDEGGGLWFLGGSGGGCSGGGFPPGGLSPVKCFAAGTPVLCPDGSRPIETICEGEEVLAYDLGARRVLKSKVLRREAFPGNFDMVEVKVSDGSQLHVTTEHAFHNGKGWVSTNDLTNATHVLDVSGKCVVVIATAPKRVDGTITYNIRTEHGNYLVGRAGLVAADRAVPLAQQADFEASEADAKASLLRH